MFDELGLYQKDIAHQLTYQIQSRTFTPVNLFGGERYSLRMTTAIESARVLSCPRGGESGCTCPVCTKFASLTMQNLIIVSHRDHESVIETALTSFVRLRTEFARQFLLRSVRILLLQYHSSLLAKSQSAAKNTAYNSASEVGDLLLDLSQSNLEISEAQANRIANALRRALKPLLLASRKNTTITVDQVRSLESWINKTSMGSEKTFIILEGLEETNASARNSLLKLFEEPPSDVYFFLISEYPNRIMQTILSRVRKYSFPPLAKEATNALLTPFFLGEQQCDNLESFFLQGGGLDIARHEEVVSMLLEAILRKSYLSGEQLNELLAFVEGQGKYEYLLKQMLASLGTMVASNQINWQRAKALGDLISSFYNDAKIYNQNKSMMLESLYLKLMEV